MGFFNSTIQLLKINASYKIAKLGSKTQEDLFFHILHKIMLLSQVQTEQQKFEVTNEAYPLGNTRDNM